MHTEPKVTKQNADRCAKCEHDRIEHQRIRRDGPCCILECKCHDFVPPNATEATFPACSAECAAGDGHVCEPCSYTDEDGLCGRARVEHPCGQYNHTFMPQHHGSVEPSQDGVWENNSSWLRRKAFEADKHTGTIEVSAAGLIEAADALDAKDAHIFDLRVAKKAAIHDLFEELRRVQAEKAELRGWLDECLPPCQDCGVRGEPTVVRNGGICNDCLTKAEKS